MATTVYGNTVNSVWRVYLTYEVTTNNETTYTVTITSGLNIPTSGYKSSRAYNLTVYQNGASKYTGSLASATRYGTNSWAMVSSKTISVTKTTAQQTLTIEAKLKGSSESTLSTKSVSFTVPAKKSYSVSYNANGGSLPSSASGFVNPQTKWYNTTLTLNTGKPTRTGYTFLRWNTNASGSGTNYASGASYTANADATLSAVWQANTVQISYNANGGQGSIANQTKTYGQTLNLSNGAGFTRTNHSLVKWNTKADGTGTDYALSQQLGTTFLTPLTLYAQWHLDYLSPIITNFDAYRVASASSSTETDNGEYIYVKFDYQAGTADAGTTWQTPTCTIEIDGTTVYNSTLTIDANGQGSFPSSTVAYGDSYSKDTIHTVEVTLVDTYNVPVSAEAQIATATYPIDLIGSGNDVYMGVMTPAAPGQTLKLFVDAIYPVGSYYETSDASFDPNTYFGGTWSLEASGQVHVSAGTGYTIGATGGATTSATGDHTLTTTEIPAHTHNSKTLTGGINLRQNAVTGGASGIVANTDTTWSGTHSVLSVANATNPIYHKLTITATHTHDSVGGGGAHNHGNVSTMQPYIVVNRWHRTA